MLIKCWGARGSIPVCGQDFVKYGGDTTCLEICLDSRHRIILDAGTGLRRLGEKLALEENLHLSWLFTHSHWDHNIGFPHFIPLLRKGTKINLYGNEQYQGNLLHILAKLMQAPFFPLDFQDIKAEITYRQLHELSLELDGVKIQCIPLSHPNQGLGFKFMAQDKVFVFLTDNELQHIHPGGRGYDEYLRFCQGADLLMHDAEYMDLEYEKVRTWGHSTAEQALNLGIQAGAKQLGLFHHNRNRDDRQLDDIVRRSEEEVRQRKSDLHCFAVRQDQEIVL